MLVFSKLNSIHLWHLIEQRKHQFLSISYNCDMSNWRSQGHLWSIAHQDILATNIFLYCCTSNQRTCMILTKMIIHKRYPNQRAHDLNQDDHSHALSHAHMLAHFSTKYSLNFFLKQWFGDAEKLTKALFSFASRLAPVIIFVDEVRLLKWKKKQVFMYSRTLFSLLGLKFGQGSTYDGFAWPSGITRLL